MNSVYCNHIEKLAISIGLRPSLLSKVVIVYTCVLVKATTRYVYRTGTYCNKYLWLDMSAKKF
jgi:hypothetical protein